MGRMPRIQIERGLYFIFTRGDHGNSLFLDDTDYRQCMELLMKYRQQYAFKLFSYALLPTYLFLLLEVAVETTISQVMHAVNSSYTKYFNSRYNKKGHLFQERFKAILIDKGQHLADVTRYIHAIPSMEGLADSPEGYQWSSCRYYLLGDAEDAYGVRANATEVLRGFSEDTHEQIRFYKEYMESVDRASLLSFGKKLQQSYIFGSKEFVEDMHEQSRHNTAQRQGQHNGGIMEHRFHKMFIIAGSLLIIILLAINVYSYLQGRGLHSQYAAMIEKQSAEFSQRLNKEVQRLKSNLDEKHMADKVSYKAMQERLEFEKNKAKDLEDKLKNEEKVSKAGD